MSDPAGSRRLVVTLDGPGSSGKSAVGSAAARRIGYRFCDTGLLYRALTWAALAERVDPRDGEALAALVPRINLLADGEGCLERVAVDGHEVTEQLRDPDVERCVSEVARHPAVRASALGVQRALAGDGGIIMAGRDIGSVVLPDADLKLWLEVPVAERAARRASQRGLPPDGAEARAIEEHLRRRDEIDSTREVAPLVVPEGAVVVHTSGNTLEQTIDAVVERIREAEDALVDDPTLAVSAHRVDSAP